jgi:YesN/AraC family two-component response regulator
VTLMGGEIAVTSEVGVGSEFTVHIPIELVASHQLPVTGDQTPVTSDQRPLTGDRQPVTDQKLQEDGQTTKPHVLVVEDNADLRTFIIDSLGDEFHFLEAENGVQGLEKATKEIPDLIISDVMMPEMDGITMAGKIKTDIRTSHIPLILLTAKSSEDSKLSGLSSGADDYLTKPFNKNELLLKVRNGVSRQLKLREKLRAELMSTAPKVEVLSEDEKFLNSVKEKILERLSDEQLSVESLADDMGMSRVQLYRKVSGLTGISVNELIRKLRLQRAAQLLKQNWGPVSQVAYEVGFSNLSYFSKVFKEEFGVLPSEFHSMRKSIV